MGFFERHYHFAVLFGRILLAMVFISGGLSKAPSWSYVIEYMARHKVPWTPIFLFPAIFLEVLGGLGVLMGYQTRKSAFLLSVYLIPASLILHGYWSFQDMERQVQFDHLMKNISILGGLLGLAANGPGIYSLDSKLTMRKHDQIRQQETLRDAS